MIDKLTAESVLDQNEYIFQEGDTVSIAEDIIHNAMEQFANLRVIEELEKVYHNSDYATNIALHHRLQELKQD